MKPFVPTRSKAVKAYLIAFSLITCCSISNIKARGEELVAKIHESVHLNLSMSGLCAPGGGGGEDPMGIFQSCKSPSIANEAWGVSVQALKEHETFIVYTKQEVDAKIGDLRTELAESVRKGSENASSALKDTSAEILKRIDALPTNLPADTTFSKVMLDRLKSDITKVIDDEIDKLRPMIKKPGE